MDRQTREALRIPIHESGHVVASMLRNTKWAFASAEETDAYAGHVRFDATGLDAETLGFIHFAGPAAESIFLRQPVGKVIAAPANALDRSHFRDLLPTHQLQWMAQLEAEWDAIVECAMRLHVAGTLSPNDPDPLLAASSSLPPEPRVLRSHYLP